MADFGDRAQALTETHIADSMKKRKTLTVPFSGFCLACEEPVQERRFCDSDCREEFENRQRRKMHGGQI